MFQLEELSSTADEKIMIFTFKSDSWVFWCNVYTSTMDSNEGSKSSFSACFGDCLMCMPNEDKIILIGDFNAWVGADFKTWNCLGKQNRIHYYTKSKCICGECMVSTLCVQLAKSIILHCLNEYVVNLVLPES